MSCWQSTILLLYHREKVTFALPRVRPVGPIYGPIACNVLKLRSFKDSWRIVFLTATSVDQPHPFSTILVQMLSQKNCLSIIIAVKSRRAAPQLAEKSRTATWLAENRTAETQRGRELSPPSAGTPSRFCRNILHLNPYRFSLYPRLVK